MNDLEKLRIMLPHWIEHNQSHCDEFVNWFEKTKDTAPEVASLLQKAVSSIQDVQLALEAALREAGGPVDGHGHGHDTHHHHHH